METNKTIAKNKFFLGALLFVGGYFVRHDSAIGGMSPMLYLSGGVLLFQGVRVLNDKNFAEKLENRERQSMQNFKKPHVWKLSILAGLGFTALLWALDGFKGLTSITKLLKKP